MNNLLLQRGYNGNKLLKKADTDIEWDVEKIEELYKCSQDPIYFAEKYIKIVHIDKGLIPIELYDYQKEIIKNAFDNRRCVVLTARQSGKTTSAVVIILFYILFNKHKEVGILANKEAGAIEVLSRIKLAYEALPQWLQQGIVEWNKKSIELENGCKVFVGATTSSSLRGKSLSFLYVDEAAFIEGYDEFFGSVYPTISSGTTSKLLLTSTPNGLNHFHKVWTKAIQGKNGYAYTFVTWNMVPGRDEKWKKETLDALNHDEDRFAQEYEGEFLGSSGTLISGATLKQLVDQIPLHSDESLGLKVYAQPVEEKLYTCVVDVSRGKGLDYSAFHILDTSQIPYTQVAAFRNNTINTFDYTEVIHRICKSYNEAFALIEINDIGQEVANMLANDFEYENIFFTETNGKAGKRISAGFGGTNQERGIRTTKSVKSIGCSMIKTLVEQKQILINDETTLDEMKCFSKKGNSYEAETGKTDDLMMGLVLFGWLTTQQLFKEITDTNTLMKFKQLSREQISEDLMPFGFTFDDLDQTNIEVPSPYGINDIPIWRPGWMQEDF